MNPIHLFHLFQMIHRFHLARLLFTWFACFTYFLVAALFRKYGFPLRTSTAHMYELYTNSFPPFILINRTGQGQPEGKRSSPTARMHNRLQTHYWQNRQNGWKKLEHRRYKEPGPSDLLSVPRKKPYKNIPNGSKNNTKYKTYPKDKTYPKHVPETKQNWILLRKPVSNTASAAQTCSCVFLGFKALHLNLAELQTAILAPTHSTSPDTQ